MLSRSRLTGKYYQDEDCVFFKNPIQSAYYVFRGAKLVDLDVTDNLKFVFVFTKADHNRLKMEWKNRKPNDGE